jgi:hypothetical protein
MSRKPLRASKPDGKYNIVIRIPGWLKNQLVEHCASNDSTINQWVSAVVLEALREQKGLPPAPDPTSRIPTTADQIHAYMAGEKLTQPCGRTDCEPEWQQLQNMRFCKKCGVRGI